MSSRSRSANDLAPDAIARCLDTIDALRELAPDDPRYLEVERAVAHLTKTAKHKRRVKRRELRAARDREVASASGRVAAYLGGNASEPGAYIRQRRCYICKLPFRRLHAFYHMLCEPCAERNFTARSASADLSGRRALVTGGRVKIGFELVRALCNAGARVTVTTRFPRDAARRFAEAELDVAFVGLDFRDLRGVLAWTSDELARGEPLDILINNAAQTVRRPDGYYAALAAAEQGRLPSGQDLALFPPGVDEEEIGRASCRERV